MRRFETERRSDSGHTVLSGAAPTGNALAVIGDGTGAEGADRRRFAVQRAHAGFLAQLIVSADPTLRPSRSERTRSAASRYAATARHVA